MIAQLSLDFIVQLVLAVALCGMMLGIGIYGLHVAGIFASQASSSASESAAAAGQSRLAGNYT